MRLSANQVWWKRVRRAAERRGNAGSELLSDWTHDMIEVLSAEGIGFDLVPGRGWVETPAERFTDEFKQAETQRLTDELGVRLGVGPMPGELVGGPEFRNADGPHADAHA